MYLLFGKLIIKFVAKKSRMSLRGIRMSESVLLMCKVEYLDLNFPMDVRFAFYFTI